MVEDVSEILCRAGLDDYTDNFKQQGFTTGESLMILTMQDYHKFGVVQTEDKRKLFQIIQQQKQVKNKEGGSRMSSVIARLTSSDLPEKKSKEKKGTPPEPTPPNSTYFNRATFLRRSFNKTKGSDSESKTPKFNASVRERCQSSQPAYNSKRLNNSASAENLNAMHGQKPALRKSASGRSEAFPPRQQRSSEVQPTRTRSKTTSIITGSINKSKNRPAGASDKIKVCVRKRPLNRKERTRNEEDIVDMINTNQCHVSETKTSVDLSKFIQKHCYLFDAVFKEGDDNEIVYRNTAKPLVDWVFQGNKATCFAYGQTGSGKTHTMMGCKASPGIVLLAAKDIFTTVERDDLEFRIFVSFYEIYCGQLFDLINKRKRLNALENAKKAICIVGLQEREVARLSDVTELLSQGGNRRSSGSTSVNAESSRSHAILQIEIKTPEGKVYGKFSFIDLAGSERAADVSDTSRQTRMEGAEINTSLLALKECIRALDKDSKHTPFRQSKLTQVLRDSFIGNSKTCMIASISPNISSCEDTLNTLRYADRVKELGRGDDGGVPEQTSPDLPSQRRSSISRRDDDTTSKTSISPPPTTVTKNQKQTSPPREKEQPRQQNGNRFAGTATITHHTDSFGFLDTSDVGSDLPSDISLVSRTDESDVSFISAASEQVVTDGLDSSSHDRSEPKHSKRFRRIVRTSTASNGSRSSTTREDSVYVYPKPPSNTTSRRSERSNSVSEVKQMPPPAAAPATTSSQEGAWALERTKTMASAPRSRMVISENKMKKAQDDLVASHQIHISQVTNLCHIEGELLQNFTDGHLEFTEYMKKLESILESKNKCVESLRAQVACYSLRATY